MKELLNDCAKIAQMNLRKAKPFLPYTNFVVSILAYTRIFKGKRDLL
jgi:hypothetical protein